MTSERTATLANMNLWNELIALRDRQRERRKTAVQVVRLSELPLESNEQGLMRWYLHPSITDTVLSTLSIYRQDIPPGSRSGKHRHLAEECLYVVEGRGYDLHQDCDVEITDTYTWKPQDEIKRFEWEAGDVIYIPPCTIHQHFNADPAHPARLISCINRIYKNSGLNDLEQLENAPEYDAKVVLTADVIKRYLAGKVKEPA